MSHWGIWFLEICDFGCIISSDKRKDGLCLGKRLQRDEVSWSWQSLSEITPDPWHAAPHAEKDTAALLLCRGVKLYSHIPILCLHWKVKTLWTWPHDVVLLIAGHNNQGQLKDRTSTVRRGLSCWRWWIPVAIVTGQGIKGLLGRIPQCKTPIQACSHDVNAANPPDIHPFS